MDNRFTNVSKYTLQYQMNVGLPILISKVRIEKYLSQIRYTQSLTVIPKKPQRYDFSQVF